MSRSVPQRYPSDLTDLQWTRLEALLPRESRRGRHRYISQREIANAINYRWETGCVWRMLPHDFPPWGTVYAYFRIWLRTGVIRQFRDLLLEPRPKPVRRYHVAPQTPPYDHQPHFGSHTPADPKLDATAESGFTAPHPRPAFPAARRPLPYPEASPS